MFNKLKNIIACLNKTNVSDLGLGIKELPPSFYTREKHIKSEDFKRLVTEHFASKIRELGFKGKDFMYYRENKVYTEIVFFWTYRTGGAIQVDLLIKFNDVLYPPEFLKIKIHKLRSEHCEFWKKLSPINSTGWFWVFQDTIEENIPFVNDIWNTFEKFGIPYFNNFQNHRDYISKLSFKNVHEIEEFTISHLSKGGETSVLYFLMTYWDQQNDKQKALHYAKTGIAKNYTDDIYQPFFENYIHNY
jgi:hypothetical protein